MHHHINQQKHTKTKLGEERVKPGLNLSHTSWNQVPCPQMWACLMSKEGLNRYLIKYSKMGSTQPKFPTFYVLTCLTELCEINNIKRPFTILLCQW